jgi:hypothetical protein
MSRGYIVIAQNTDEHDYLRMAYALALSIKTTQRENAICLCVDKKTSDRLEQKCCDVFDYIVDIPWNDDALNSTWKIENKWKYINMSPFDETIILDTDQLFTKSIDHWWDMLSDSKYDVLLCTNPRTFRDEPIISDFYRKKFTDCELPDVYSNFTYFNKSEVSYEFFRLVERIINNWELYYNEFLKGKGQDWVSADVAYALAAKILGKEKFISSLPFPAFVHMKSYIQNIPEKNIFSDWQDTLTSNVSDDLEINIHNFIQTLPFHYVEKDWLTNDMIKQYENVYDL